MLSYVELEVQSHTYELASGVRCKLFKYLFQGRSKVIPCRTTASIGHSDEVSLSFLSKLDYVKKNSQLVAKNNHPL